MKKLNLNELGKNILKRNNNSNLSNILNKGTLNQTRTTDYSISSQDVSLNNIKPKENEKNKKIKSKPLINIQTPDDEIKNLNKKRSHPNLNTSKKILPTNVNDFYHLIYDNLFGNYESLKWTMGLRLANNITHFFAVLKLISIFADRLKPKVYGSNCIKSNPDAPVEALLFQQ